ncbi:MAG: CNNM domain-containing protein [Planctomycetota bacterium]
MIWTALLLATGGLLFSALFSGAETGFYRATRLRLVLDSLGGDRLSTALLWLVDHPSWFVATTLAGTNVANYLVSLAVVILSAQLAESSGALSLAANVLVTPILFVYGELLPKSLFLQAPNRLLRSSAPVLLACVVIFAPFSFAFVVIGRLLAHLTGSSPQPLPMTLARRELQRVLEEGHQAGILHPAQRSLAQGIFRVAGTPVARFIVPEESVPRVPTNATAAAALEMARQKGATQLAVVAPGATSPPIGYVRVVDLAISAQVGLGKWRPLPTLAPDTSHLVALMRLQTSKDTLAQVIDTSGQFVGFVSLESLRRPLVQVGADA